MKKCPKCESDNTCKLSQIYESSTLVVDTKTSSSGIGLSSRGNMGVGIGNSSTSGTIKSVMSLKCAPPEEPSHAKEGWSIFIVISILSLILFPSNVSIPIVVLSGAIIIGIFAYITKNEMEEYQEEYDTWEKQWICNRCGYIFIPK